MAGRASSPALLTPSLLARTARLHADLGAVIERSRDLRWWGSRLRLGGAPAHQRAIRGASADDDVALAIRDKIARGLLPPARVVKIWAGHGSGAECNGCGRLITATDI